MANPWSLYRGGGWATILIIWNDLGIQMYIGGPSISMEYRNLKIYAPITKMCKKLTFFFIYKGYFKKFNKALAWRRMV
jgi:hypothetical protein